MTFQRNHSQGEMELKVLVFDGSRSGETEQEPALAVIEEEMVTRGWEVETLHLRDIEIKPCIGCFGCWAQTPGICVIDDACREVTKKLVQSDLLVIVTPVTFGGYSSEAKKALDRSLGMMLPHTMKINGKTHHRPRYKRYPRFIVVGTMPAHDPEIERVFKALVTRNSVNGHAPGHAGGVVTDGQDAEGVLASFRDLLRTAGVVM